MLSPDVQFMVHSSEVIDDEGYAHRGSKIALVEQSASEPVPWKSRDFAFAAYSFCSGTGVRQIFLGKSSIWAFASPRQHCEEVVVFRRGVDTRKKWDEDDLEDPKAGLNMFFIICASQISTETPLGKQFNGEWGFWESFFVPLVDETQTMKAFSLMDPDMAEDFFSPRSLPVTCHRCSNGERILTIPDHLHVTYEVTIACKDMVQWAGLCNKIGDDMLMKEKCAIEHKHLNPGDECITAYHENTGIEEHARLIKRDFEQLKLPVIAKFRCRLRVVDWDEDMISLQYKYDSLCTVYSMNLGGGFSSMSGAKSDPWNPMARLTVNALNTILAKYQDIQTILDVGCGDMSWIRHFLKDHPSLAYVGADIMPNCLALNSKRFPKLSFVQTDLSNLTGIEVLPRGCDLVIAKDVFNHMTLPDAVNAIRRVVGTRPRFLITHVHATADNTGWEKRIDKHLHYTKYNYNKSPFSLPYPATEIQRISDEAYFVMYEISPEGSMTPPPRTSQLRPPVVDKLDAYSLFEKGSWVEPPVLGKAEPSIEAAKPSTHQKANDVVTHNFGPKERTKLTVPVTELPHEPKEDVQGPERIPVKGISPVEFRARCDSIFDKFDIDKDGALRFDEVAAMMEVGGRRVESFDVFEGLCNKLGCDASAGISRSDLHRFFEKAPEALWDDVYRSVDPLAGTACRGAESLPETSLERPLQEFLFEDGETFATVHIELNAQMYYGAAEFITEDKVQAFFGPKRFEVHVCAPGSFGAKELYKWKLIASPLTAEIVPEDSKVELLETTGRFGAKRVSVSLMKREKKRWHKVGVVTTSPKD